MQSKYYWTNSFYDFDTVDYRFANDSYGVGDADIKIVADLQLGTVQKLNASTGNVLHTDTLVGADAVSASFASDVFYGRNFWDYEQFQGFGGNDYFDGRGGTDGVVYNTATTSAGIEVELADGTVEWKDGVSGIDTLRQIELITGTNFADTFDAAGFGATSTNDRNSFGQTYNLYNPMGGDDTIVGNGDTILNYGTSLGGNITVDLSGLVDGTSSAHIITSFSDDPNSTSGVTPGNILASGVNAVRGGNYSDTLIGGSRSTLWLQQSYLWRQEHRSLPRQRRQRCHRRQDRLRPRRVQRRQPVARHRRQLGGGHGHRRPALDRQ